MPFYERGDVRIHYEEAGAGFPLLVIPGGGLNSTIAGVRTHPFNPMEEFKDEYRCIVDGPAQRQRRRVSGPLRSTGRGTPTPTISSGLMDHLGIQRVHGDGLLHRRPVHLEPVEAGAGAHRGRRAGAAERVPPGDAGPLLQQQHHRLGPAACALAAPTSAWTWSMPS